MSHEGHDNFGQGAPPTVSHIEPASPVWPTVIGVISIVFGLLGALQGCGGIVMPFAMNGLTGLMPDDQSKAVFAGMSDHLAWGVAAGVTGMAVGVLLLTAGIGMVQRRRWGVRAHTIWAVLAILQSGVGGVYGFLIQQSQFQAMKAGGMPPTPFPMEAFAAVGVLVGLLFACAYPVFMLVWVFRSVIRDQVAGWR
jgi:hypothetical protein